MHRPSRLPDELQGRPFRVSEALALGVTAKRLRSQDVWAPFTGMRVQVALGWGPELRARCGLLVCPPNTAVVAFDAVAVAGLPLPFPVEDLLGQPLVVAPPVALRPFRRGGLEVDPLPLALTVPRVDDGVLRPADPDLWVRVVHRPPVHADYAVLLGRAVLERCDGRPEVLEEALRRRSPRALVGSRWLLRRICG